MSEVSPQEAGLSVVETELSRMLGVISLDAEMSVRDGSEAVAKVTEAILTATTLDEILDGAELEGTSLEDLVGYPVLIESVEWGKGTIEGSAFPYYAIITGKNLITHEEFSTTSGARSVMLQLFKIKDADLLPASLEVRSKPTSEGNTIYYFGRLSKVNNRYAPKAKAN